MKTRPLSPALGLEIEDCDLSTHAGLDWDQIAALLYRHQLLVFPAQRLSNADLVTINHRLGPPQAQKPRKYTLQGHEEIFLLSNIVEDGRQIGSTITGFGWHTDTIYLAEPTALTMLYMVEVPAEGGSTLFASTQAALDALPEDTVSRLRQARTVHSVEAMYARRRNAPPVPEEERVPIVSHPIVRVHPHTGREGLFISRNSLCGVESPYADLTEQTVVELIEYATQPQFCYEHRSRPGDFILWDNRGMLHSATDYDFEKDRRLVYRMVTGGEVPIGSNP